MSEERLRHDADRWFRQAEDNRAAAGALIEAEKYAQAAFLSQQTAELAMKSVWIALDLDPWGHSVARLVKALPEETERPIYKSRDRSIIFLPVSDGSYTSAPRYVK